MANEQLSAVVVWSSLLDQAVGAWEVERVGHSWGPGLVIIGPRQHKPDMNALRADKRRRSVWTIVGISFLSGLSTPVGAWIVTRFQRLSREMLALLLGVAGGIMVTVVAVELMPTSIAVGGQRVFWAGAAAGWVFLWLLQKAFRHPDDTGGVEQQHAEYRKLGWLIAIAISLHDLPEGLAIGAGDAVTHQIGVVIALAIAFHNLPEGMSIGAPLVMAGVSKRRILWSTLLIGMITPLGTMFSIWLFSVSQVFIALSLAFASGTMAFVVAQDILPEAFRHSAWYTSAGAFGGTALMFAISALHM
ncbi:ZIP family metal transporter [Alicyclobacillus tolerans]|uniref:ZIP family metal transporter n=1 Tax=Alicyclobacillus tolerans TaxID=90970 RepID=UPI001F20567A|nr:ZIP family metal transporter [Alicyclobacillus tolerans]MCF8564924.1 ZIP family metal transporter [Alicyclobacillus tolerans]